jgi:hypothetical protein
LRRSNKDEVDGAFALCVRCVLGVC